LEGSCEHFIEPSGFIKCFENLVAAQLPASQELNSMELVFSIVKRDKFDDYDYLQFLTCENMSTLLFMTL
jgi:hypothetical protein